MADAPLFSDFEKWSNPLEATYKGVFADLVFGEMPDMDEIVQALAFLNENIVKARKA